MHFTAAIRHNVDPPNDILPPFVACCKEKGLALGFDEPLVSWSRWGADRNDSARVTVSKLFVIIRTNDVDGAASSVCMRRDGPVGFETRFYW